MQAFSFSEKNYKISPELKVKLTLQFSIEVCYQKNRQAARIYNADRLTVRFSMRLGQPTIFAAALILKNIKTCDDAPGKNGRPRNIRYPLEIFANEGIIANPINPNHRMTQSPSTYIC